MANDSSHFSITLLRDKLLPNLLQNDQEQILYWAGKELAEQYPHDNLDSLIDFFQTAEFGDLEIKKDKRQKAIFLLSGDVVYDRMQTLKIPSFALESGFLARTYENIVSNSEAESEYTILSNKQIEFTVHIFQS